MCEKQNQKISAEAQTKTSAQAEADFSGIQQTITYLAEREANLARYSDKMSKALYQIAETVNNLKISRDLEFLDAEPFIINVEEEDNIYEKGYLYINGTLKAKFVKTYGTKIEDENAKTEYWIFQSIPRRERKAIIASGRLPKFLKLVAEKLAETEQEYKEVMDAAEKMAVSLTS
jgi:uncharacterized caspase-like protein